MDPSYLQLSQGHLSDLTTCPRKFQHQYLEQLRFSTLDSQSDSKTLGTQFHHLMQQHSLGLDIQGLLASHPKLQAWFSAYQQAPPPMIDGQPWSEHQRFLWLQSYGLIVIYDRLIVGPAQAQILDWKTYPQPRRSRTLSQSWQTRLYLFVLAETSPYRPEQLTMTYWFAEQAQSQAAGAASFVTLTYTQALHEQTRQDLTLLLEQLDHGLQGYAKGQAFPQVPFAAGHCYREGYSCPFLVHCQRQSMVTGFEQIYPSLADIEAIPEVPI